MNRKINLGLKIKSYISISIFFFFLRLSQLPELFQCMVSRSACVGNRDWEAGAEEELVVVVEVIAESVNKTTH